MIYCLRCSSETDMLCGLQQQQENDSVDESIFHFLHFLVFILNILFVFLLSYVN